MVYSDFLRKQILCNNLCPSFNKQTFLPNRLKGQLNKKVKGKLSGVIDRIKNELQQNKLYGAHRECSQKLGHGGLGAL